MARLQDMVLNHYMAGNSSMALIAWLARTLLTVLTRGLAKGVPG
jgi:hypothetical protein